MSTHSTVNVTEGPTPPTTSLEGVSMAGMAHIVYICIGIVGLLDNLFVLVVLAGTSRLRRKVTIMFIINQSLIDLAVSIIMIASADAGSEVRFSFLFWGVGAKNN